MKTEVCKIHCRALCNGIVVAGEKKVYKNEDGGKGRVDGVCKRTKRSVAEESLGRALDALFEKDVTTVFAQVASLKKAKSVQMKTEERNFQATSDPDYRSCELRETFGEVEHRWFVIESTKASVREQESAKKKVAASQNKEKKELAALKREELNCWEDVELFLRKAEKKWQSHVAEHLEFEEVYHFETRGKPKKDAKPSRIGWKIIGGLEENKEAVKKAMSMVGRFVLATNMPFIELNAEEAFSQMFGAEVRVHDRNHCFLWGGGL